MQDEEFVILLERGVIPHTHHVRGSNYNLINVFPDRIPGRAIITSVVCLWSTISILKSPHMYSHCYPGIDDHWLSFLNILQIDNLVKGASGQALQNLNIMLGYPEKTGLLYQPLFP